jgi:hypothetical protein
VSFCLFISLSVSFPSVTCLSRGNGPNSLLSWPTCPQLSLFPLKVSLPFFSLSTRGVPCAGEERAEGVLQLADLSASLALSPLSSQNLTALFLSFDLCAGEERAEGVLQLANLSAALRQGRADWRPRYRQGEHAYLSVCLSVLSVLSVCLSVCLFCLSALSICFVCFVCLSDFQSSLLPACPTPCPSSPCLFLSFFNSHVFYYHRKCKRQESLRPHWHRNFTSCLLALYCHVPVCALCRDVTAYIACHWFRAPTVCSSSLSQVLPP